MTEQDTAVALRRVMHTWAITRNETAAAFGVTPQAITNWEASEVPVDHREALGHLAEATDILTHHLKAERIPVVVRRPAVIMGDESLIALVTRQRTREVAQLCREMFQIPPN